MSQPTIGQLEDVHEAQRAEAARASYIRWRMADLPGVYTNLMPPTYNAKVLWEAERSIRFQYLQDLLASKSPWRKVGPACGLLDTTGMTPEELIEFGSDVSVPVGMPDAVKQGYADHPEVIAAREAAQRSPAMAAARKRQDIFDRYANAPLDQKQAIADELAALESTGERDPNE